MHTGIAHAAPASTISTGARPVSAPASVAITVSAIIAPIITTSPCAKLMSWMMP
jgi:hypothetical protein